MSGLKEFIRSAVFEAVEEAVLPKKWANAKTCAELYGVSRAVLNRLADEGDIRKCKTCDSGSAGALYRCADIEEWLEERAAPMFHKRGEELKQDPEEG